MTSLVGTSGASTGGFSVTVVGRGYGVSDYSVRVRVGGTACESTVWVCDSAALCKVGSGVRVGHDVAVTSGGQQGSLV
ncbi:IPT/TIG domain-containing protein, partial [Vibrio vulnificus]|uniref:IPT/TIG domain-containing protein n=1 Tax=Vibrio vulnificus TaxID=672 RepID=UPI0019D4A089|nr:IPT/TIG domain-containing protein [Vibrio vulnificus]